MTDMEGCAGVMTARDYIYNDSKYYEHACELATLEVSAAVEGALEAGATEALVVDGHGPGAMKRSLLHPKARLLAGTPYPDGFVTYGCDGTFNAALMIGQHAMSGTDGGHLSHTMSFGVEEYRVNGTPMGEIGLFMLVAGYFAVPVVMVSGDEAACAEALSFVPNIETCAVKSGLKHGTSHGLTEEENHRFNSSAVHMHPNEARARIREHAFRAVRRIPEVAPYRLEGPYTLSIVRRPSVEKPKGERLVCKSVDCLDLLRQRRRAATAKAERRPRPAAPMAPAKKTVAAPKRVPAARGKPVRKAAVRKRGK